MPYRLTAALAALALAGCGTTPTPCAPVTIEVERVERVPVPAECLAACPAAPGATPRTNGELRDRDAARGAEVACYRARLACVQAATGP
jgi:hypothetical protein